MKKVLSFILSVCVGFALTITSFSAGYGSSPGYTPTRGGGGQPGGIGGVKEVSPDTASSAVNSGQAINISTGGGAISIHTLQRIISEIKDIANASLDFVSKESGNEYLVEIPLDSIKQPRTIIATLDIKKVSETTFLIGNEKVHVPEGAIRIEPAMKGDFGMDLKITLPSSHFKNFGDDVIGIKIIYVNQNDKQTKVLNEFLYFNEDGSLTFTINKASEYFILPIFDEPESETDGDKKPASNTESNNNTGSSTNRPSGNNTGGGSGSNTGGGNTGASTSGSNNTGNNNINSENTENLSDNDNKNSAPWWSGLDINNPTTGVLISGGGIAIISAVLAIATKKRRR